MPSTSIVVNGVVIDEGGEPVPGARVMFLTGPVALPDVATLSDSDGSFTLSAPLPGRYELAAYTKDGEGFLTIELPAARLTTVSLILGVEPS